MRVFTSILKLAVGLAVMAVCTLGFSFVCLFLLPSRRLRITVTNVFGRMAGYGCAWLTGARFDRKARRALDAYAPAIYVSNHTSLADIFFGIWLTPLGTCGIGKREVIWYPFFGQIFALGGHLRLDRRNIERAKEEMKDIAAFVRKNKLGIWIWPEGTRSTSGRLQTFKKGFAHMALATGYPVVPVVVTGMHNVWRNRTLLIQPGDVTIRALPPIDTSNWRAETIDEHIAEVHAAFNRALPEDQKGPPMVVGAPVEPPPSRQAAVPAVVPAPERVVPAAPPA